MNNSEITKETFNVFECSEISDSLKQFWTFQDLTNDSFFCKECGQLMLDIEDLKGVHYRLRNNSFTKDGVKNAYIESLQNRSLVKGRFFSDKFFTRVLCWDCFHKQMKEYISSHKGEIKYHWYRMFLKNKIDEYYPVAWQSETFYFKFLFNMTDEELHNECRKFVTADLDFFINKFGKKEGPVEYEKYRKIQAYAGCTEQYFIDKYGEEEGRKKYQKVSKSKAVTKDGCIQRYGRENGLMLFKDYCSQQAYSGCAEQYFIDKYGEEEGKKKYQEVCLQKINSLDNMIRKYGKEEGTKRYEQFKRASSFGYSRISQELFVQIDRKLGDYAKDSMWEEKNAEKVVSANNRHYILDYTLNNKIIEFNGDFWHMNPELYLSNDFNRQTKKQAYEVWQGDSSRVSSLKNLGYEVKTVWEHDYRENPTKVVEECCRFLSDEKISPKNDNMDEILAL